MFDPIILATKINRKRRIYFLGSILSCTLTGAIWGSSDSQAGEGEEITTKLRKFITEIKSASDVFKRSESAKELAKYLSRFSEKEAATAVLDDEINDIAMLLNDDSEAVRVWVASALGRIGPKARQALPTLTRLRDQARFNASLIVPGPNVDVAGLYESIISKISNSEKDQKN